MPSEDSRAPRVMSCAKEILLYSGILRNSYLQALQDGSMSLEVFQRTQEQFSFAVSFFPKPMAALIGRLPDPKPPMDVLRGILDEQGASPESAAPQGTFHQFLRTIGCQPEQLAGITKWPAVRAFMSVLTASCVVDEIEVGASCMGIIQLAFAPISAIIGKAIIRREWVAEQDLVYYQLHAQIDERHAEELFALIEPGWDDDRGQYYIKQGLELGLYTFDRLLRDMLIAGRHAK